MKNLFKNRKLRNITILTFVLISAITAITVWAVGPSWPCGDFNWWNCTAADISVNRVWIGDVSGVDLTSCQSGEIVSAYIWVTIDNHTGTERVAAKLLYDLFIDSVDSGSSDVCVAELIPAGTIADYNVQSINWSCGSTVELRNFVLSFSTGDTCSSPTCTNRKAKCYKDLSLPVEALPSCGDGLLDLVGEGCDDGESNGDICTPSYNGNCQYCSLTCTYQTVDGGYCGDNQIDQPDEECDDDSPQVCTTVEGYSGFENCVACLWGECITEEFCGDGVKNGNEQCDDGNTQDGDGCSATCQSEPAECNPSSIDWDVLDEVDIGTLASEFYHPIDGWSEENIPGGYGGCQNGVLCTYRQVLGEPGTLKCTEDERDATVVLHAGSNVVDNLKIKHLDGVSLLDSFNVYVNNTSVGNFKDLTQISTEVWVETEFDISSYNFTGDLTIKLRATDTIWPNCNIFGQVSIDWIKLNGCGTPWEPHCGDSILDTNAGEECDDGNNTSGDDCSASCQIEPTPPASVCGDGNTDSGEECDDGNNVDSDGCSATCEIEPDICSQFSSDWTILDEIDVGTPGSEFYHSIGGWSEADLPGNYGGYGGSSDTYRQVLGEPGESKCKENERDATVVLHAGSNVVDNLEIRHLDGISLLDSFEIYINDILTPVGYFDDDTDESTEIWRTTEFDISSHGFTGDLTVRLHATDGIWSNCDTYGQVSIDWMRLNGCGTPWVSYCGDGILDTGDEEECDDGGLNGQECPSPPCGQSCTYCSSECALITLQGGSCGSYSVGSVATHYAPKLTIEKSVTEEFANPGSTINYTIVIKNTGSAVAYNIVLTDTLPDGLTYTDTGLSTREWDLGTLGSGAEETTTYQVDVDEDVEEGDYLNTAEVESDSLASVLGEAIIEIREGEVLGETITVLPKTGASSNVFFILFASLAGLTFGTVELKKTLILGR